MNYLFAKRFSLLLVALFSLHTVLAQQVRREAPPEAPLDDLNEAFTDAASLKRWHRLHQAEDGPDKFKTFQVKDGVLELEPLASGWYADYQAPFIFKPVTGNFDVRAKIKVSGAEKMLPQTEWSLAGLMVRQAKVPGVVWQPRQENWLFLTTGIAEPKGSPVFETKSTNNSLSNLKLRPAREGWVELRIVRVQASFILLYRYEGETWTVLERFYRPLLPQELQVGINAYSGWNGIPATVKADPVVFNRTLLTNVPVDLRVQVAKVHFARPQLNWEKLKEFSKDGFRAHYYSLSNLLTDYVISDETLLEIIGQ